MPSVNGKSAWSSNLLTRQLLTMRLPYTVVIIAADDIPAAAIAQAAVQLMRLASSSKLDQSLASTSERTCCYAQLLAMNESSDSCRGMRLDDR